jgi:hypothetical protein
MQAVTTIELLKHVGNRKFASGKDQGRSAFEKLRTVVEGAPQSVVFEISAAGIEATDASFPRESVVALVKLYRGERGFFVSHLASQDVIDNWDYAARAKEVPLILERSRGKYDLIGVPLTSGARELFDYAMKEGTVTTAKVTAAFDLSPQNASQKLKKLHQLGLLLGEKATAETGGLEYVYQAIRRF